MKTLIQIMEHKKSTFDVEKNIESLCFQEKSGDQSQDDESLISLKKRTERSLTIYQRRP